MIDKDLEDELRNCTRLLSLSTQRLEKMLPRLLEGRENMKKAMSQQGKTDDEIAKLLS